MMRDFKENREIRLRAEIWALIHDLGKLSEEFISQKSYSTTCDRYLFEHNLILGRSIQPQYIINSKDDTTIYLSDNNIYSIEKKLYKYIKEKNELNIELNIQKLKKFIIAVVKDEHSIDISNNKAEKLYNFIQELYSYGKTSSENQNELFNHLNHQNSLILNNEKICFADIVAKHHDGEIFKSVPSGKFLKLFKQVDGLDSGIDKGALNNCGKQPKDETYRATSFGYEIEKINISSLSGIRENLCKQLNDNLRKRFEITDIHKNIRHWFLYGLGDTRRSGNDVTLWDHSYSVANLYKSALAKINYENKWIEPKEIKWRIIAIQYDKLGLIEKANKLGDIVGYRALTENVDKKIKKIIEEEIAIGNEIYRDETGIYFVGPDINSDLFNWGEIPGNDNGRLIEFLMQYYNIEWINSATIKKNDNDKTIRLTDDTNYLSLTLNNEKTNVKLEIDDGRTDILIVKTENDKLNIYTDEWFKPVKNEIIQKVQEITDGEVIPHITLGESSRSLVNLTDILKNSKYNFSKKETIPAWAKKWENMSMHTVNDTDISHSYCKNLCQYKNNCTVFTGSNEYQIDICPVCKVHPKCEHQNICKNCLDRRESRIKEWEKGLNSEKNIQNKLYRRESRIKEREKGKYQTIWIDEIADNNKKIAIVTGRFNLFGWLNGELLNTIFSQTLDDYGYNYVDLRNKLAECLKSNKDKCSLLEEIAKDAYKNYNCARDFYDAIIADRNPMWKDAKMNWDGNPDFQKASEYLLLTLFRKHPSPARLRRIWETTLKFWEDVQGELKNNDVLKYKNEKDLNNKENVRFKRIEIKLNKKPPGNILYNVKIGKFDIIMYFDGEKLISTQNLTFSGLREDLYKYKNEIIRMKREDEKDSKFKEYKINEISFSEDQYNPFLEILLSPISFQFIIPATSVPHVIQMIQEKYCIEMGEVFGRLPLNMGVVIFDYKTALYAAINASRKMLQGFEDKPAEKFIVKSISNNGIIEFLNNYNKKSLKFNKSIEKSSHYYRNFIIENNENIETRDGYFKSYINSEERALLNATKIIDKDKVELYTNHFDFEFLDTISRRLEIRYNDDNYKRIDQTGIRGPRPYYLEEFESVFKKCWELLNTLTITQIKKMQMELAKIHYEWVGHEISNTFKIQIENILINIGSRKWWDSINEEDQILLKRICYDKTIFDVLEFYNSILKLKPSGEYK